MKKKIFFTAIMVVLGSGIFAQESESPWTAGADVVSAYVWRGLYLSNAAVQPALSYSSGGFEIGGWGSASFDGALEADLFAAYTFGFGLTLGLTDYYFPSMDGGNDYFESAIANPDLMLSDVVKAAYPNLLPNYSYSYIKPLN